MPDELAERISVGAPPAHVYRAVSDVNRWRGGAPSASPRWSGPGARGAPARCVRLNRRGPWVWFTTCQVVAARPGEEFAFDVTTFGMPVSRWSYRLAPVDGGTEVTE